ncbi:nuclear pore complex protein Nup93-like [Agrilus planipennis]|uniref:Nuclear pore protein n=1 Tax=Agrilus planipennis TaxID=224129 RepID=A0A1W4XKT3_AGRPL|nr:nuclear pore complex protein Nup93-like [Agrilus planipennis]XP_018336594.1 nuclear pore complex protein Nup93-like [Agrilus planipennis]
MASSDFMDLVQEAEKLTANIEGTSELPKVERSLRQVLEASNELYSKVAQAGARDIQANILLGSKGVDLPRIAQKLENISAKRTFEPIAATDDSDLQTCLENEIRSCILSVIDAEHKACLETVSQHSWEHELGEWKEEKRKILNAMLGPSENFIDIGKHTSVFMEPPALGATALGYYESVYASKIIEYNRAIIRGTFRPHLVESLINAASEFKETKVNDMWEMIKYMIQVPPFPSTEDPLKTRNSPRIIKALVKQACHYLEDRYKIFMESVLNENLKQAQRGGIPGTYSLVRSFVGIRLKGEYLGLQDGMIDDRPLWPMVYYCLRSGDLSATLYCLKKSDLHCPELIELLELLFTSPENSQIAKLESNIKFHYRRFVRNSTDPFKRIVWAVLGCCDVVDEHTEVAKTADDYLWLKLSLVRTDYDKEDHIKYFDLQTTVLEEYGESHYDAMNQPHLYFEVLVLTGQFEAALEFLARIEKFRVHGVHIAIVLSELHMLAAPRDPAAPLISIDPMDIKPGRRLNMARLIMLYVQRFELSCVAEAVHYFFFLRNLRSKDNVNLFLLSVSDLAQETKDYEGLFGKMQPNNVRSKGMIDEFKTAGISTESLVEVVAEQCVKKGVFEEAVDLFDLAGNQERVLNLLCILLAQVVHLPSKDGSLRERLEAKAHNIAERYSRSGFNCSSQVASTFLVLKDLLTFFDQYHAKQYVAALKTLADLELIPLNSNELDLRVSGFKKLSNEISKVIPDVLLATMNILFAQYQKIKGNEYMPSKFQGISVDKQLQYIRDQARVITNFTGMLPYRMPGDTNSRLVQMEILMH